MISTTPAWQVPFESITAEINRRRPVTRARLFDALASLAPSWSPAPYWRESLKQGFAVAQHAIHAARQAVGGGDTEGARAALGLLAGSPRTTSTPVGELIVVDTGACVAGPEGQHFLTDAGAAPAAGPSEAEVRAAVGAVVETGLGPWLAQELAVVVVLRRVGDESLTNAFSVATLAGTVFLEWPSLSARAGELLLHECGHSWLNEALDCLGEDLHGEERWYSPWKRRLRSAFGIVHAVVSFSLLAAYFERLEEGASDPAVVEFARHRRVAETKRLALVRPAALECISQVRDPTLRTLLGALLDGAVEAGAPAARPTAWTTG